MSILLNFVLDIATVRADRICYLSGLPPPQKKKTTALNHLVSIRRKDCVQI